MNDWEETYGKALSLTEVEYYVLKLKHAASLNKFNKHQMFSFCILNNAKNIF